MKAKYSIIAIIIFLLIGAVFIIGRKQGEKKIWTGKEDLIVVENPKPNETISSPLEIKGRARGNWFFEASFPAKLIDGNGKEVAVIPVTAEGNWMTNEFVQFRAVMEFDDPNTINGTLILEKDNPSGLPENADRIIIPIKFKPTAEKTTVKVYWGKENDSFDCNLVFPVKRNIPKTATIGKAALLSLLEGPTREEKQVGYFSSINQGVKLNSLKIDNGIAYADFDSTLETGVGGSCRVTNIRSQITETLKQFPTVKTVVISIQGRTEDILQP